MRRVFFSFDWDDVWRVNQVRNSWVSKGGNKVAGYADAAEFETLKKARDEAIRKWIDEQLSGTSVTCVLIGTKTKESKWVQYEIDQSVGKNNGLFGVYIHGLKDQNGEFDSLSAVFPTTSNSLITGYATYDWVSDKGYKNLADWIEAAAKQAAGKCQ